MHILSTAIIVLAIMYIFWKRIASTQNQASHSKSAENFDNQNITTSLDKPISPLFISDGKLFHKTSGTTTNQIESNYVKEMKERVEKDRMLAGWKEGTTWDSSFAQMRGMGDANEENEIFFSSATKINKDNILYFLKSGSFGGLFHYSLETGNERRLLHRQNLDYQDLSLVNEKGKVLLASFQAGQNSNIALMDTEGNQYRELTGGDTMDLAPAWVRDKPGHIVYQSQGLARDSEGFLKGISPSSINLLNIEDGTLETIFSDDDCDYLKPQVSSSGDLYFIQRPYEAFHYSSHNAIVDVLKFPFRLLRAVFHYLNFFSLMYSRKPLTSASGPQVREDVKAIVIKGRRIETEKQLRKGQTIQGAPSLVPATWQLIKCDRRGQKQVLAKNVSSFYLNEQDELIYTNGCGLFYLDEKGRTSKLHQENLIEEIYM